MIKMPKLARGCLAGNGVHRSGVKMPAMHLHTAGLDSCGLRRWRRKVRRGREGWRTGYSQSLPARRIPQCDFAHRK